ncbi:MAG: hypothetical protein SGCHY_003593 [Lobulomycetales sp.]
MRAVKTIPWAQRSIRRPLLWPLRRPLYWHLHRAYSAAAASEVPLPEDSSTCKLLPEDSSICNLLPEDSSNYNLLPESMATPAKVALPEILKGMLPIPVANISEMTLSLKNGNVETSWRLFKSLLYRIPEELRHGLHCHPDHHYIICDLFRLLSRVQRDETTPTDSRIRLANRIMIMANHVRHFQKSSLISESEYLTITLHARVNICFKRRESDIHSDDMMCHNLTRLEKLGEHVEHALDIRLETQFKRNLYDSIWRKLSRTKTVPVDFRANYIFILLCRGKYDTAYNLAQKWMKLGVHKGILARLAAASAILSPPELDPSLLNSQFHLSDLSNDLEFLIELCLAYAEFEKLDQAFKLFHYILRNFEDISNNDTNLLYETMMRSIRTITPKRISFKLFRELRKKNIPISKEVYAEALHCCRLRKTGFLMKSVLDEMKEKSVPLTAGIYTSVLGLMADDKSRGFTREMTNLFWRMIEVDDIAPDRQVIVVMMRAIGHSQGAEAIFGLFHTDFYEFLKDEHKIVAELLFNEGKIKEYAISGI